jgi:ubiquinone/menaquinone biosynthesis C-methylase UbiE
MNENNTYEAKHKYKGDIASKYNVRRQKEGKWQREQSVFKEIFSKLPEGTTIVDIPIGTGRFIPFYKKFGLHAKGVDISQDMINEARKEAESQGYEMEFKQGSADQIPLEDSTSDYVVCARLLNWLPLPIFKNMTKDFARVARTGLILHIRVSRPLSKEEKNKAVRARIAKHPVRFLFNKLKRMIRKPTAFYPHDEIAVHEFFSRNGMKIVDKSCIDEAVRLEDNVKTYLYIYTLKLV